MAHTQDAVARLAADARQAIEQDRQATAGVIAAVEERATIAQLRTQQQLEANRRFQQHQSNQTRDAIDHFVVAQLHAIIEKVVVERQKQQEPVAAECGRQLTKAQDTE